jgi:glycosyltransferase involved in cell wall biosynthesis
MHSLRNILWGGRALRERMEFAARAALRPSPRAPLLLLSARPIVIHAFDWAFEPGSPSFRLLRALRRRRVDVLVTLSWNHARRRLIERLIRLEFRLRRTADHRLTFLATSTAEHVRFQRAGLRTAHVANTCMSDERIFRPLPGRQARFAAIYDARLSRFKRHELAAGVSNLALITYFVDSDPAYRAAIAPIVARAHWFNGAGDPESDAYRRLSPEEVNQALNQAAVGLALSREEGGMYASTQYLLAGLPVVSTPSEGGRDEFYHPDYVRIVDATPRAVAAGVAEMRRCKATPEEIRARTLATVMQHRQRLFRCVDEIYASQGCDRSFEAEWPSLFIDKLFPARADTTNDLLAAIEAAHAH